MRGWLPGAEALCRSYHYRRAGIYLALEKGRNVVVAQGEPLNENCGTV